MVIKFKKKNKAGKQGKAGDFRVAKETLKSFKTRPKR